MYAGHTRSWSVLAILIMCIGFAGVTPAHGAPPKIQSETFDLSVSSPDGLSWDAVESLPVQGFDDDDGKKKLSKVRIELRVQYDMTFLLTNTSKDHGQWAIVLRSQDVHARLPWIGIWNGPGGWTWGGIFLQAGQSSSYTLKAEYIRVMEFEGSDLKHFINQDMFPLDLRLHTHMTPMDPKQISMEYQDGGIRSEVKLDYTYSDDGPDAGNG